MPSRTRLAHASTGPSRAPIAGPAKAEATPTGSRRIEVATTPGCTALK
eukprot:CAMPEP_0182944014 /NCGR_PEP_ID=MMETSP0105_2-20130417/53286_1 /TAXON_ID=81532 ORGANISM="Acanthoeca-like sp., Strain 10tr" /NCGR_SAMPLE_ID=MMETSP0105_2 /ASSEMBLY_ACC=CAM_ASM_000205 /LENGTH=47 /DNA_ID= /DNA_START= /DNA_END= /DNA_ORIENTATION=